MPNDKFKFEEEKATTKEVITISGLKGTGKTTHMFRFGEKSRPPQKHYCFSFDHKSKRIKEYIFNDNPRLVILDGEKYYERTAETMVPSAAENYEYLLSMLDQIHGFGDADWVDFDCLERLHEICEMVMRNSHNLKPFQGFAEKTWWKERRVLLGSLHRKALAVAKRGVIYTTFLEFKDNLLIDDEFENRAVMPRYFDMVKDETDVIFRTISKYDKGTKELKFFVRIESSKIPKYKTGKLLDVTREVGE